MGALDELQAWTRQEVNAKAAVPHAFFLPCATCPEWTAIPAVIGLPHPKKPTPRVQAELPLTSGNLMNKGRERLERALSSMSYLTAQYTKITYFTNENENVSSRGIGCRGNKWGRSVACSCS